MRETSRAAALNAVSEVLEMVRSDAVMQVAAYRDSLPPHRRHWFDTLQPADQRRLAFWRPDRRSSQQRDADDCAYERDGSNASSYPW